MPKIKEAVKSEVKKLGKEYVEMLTSFNFKRDDIPEEKQKKYEGYIATYAVRVTAEGSGQSHVLICSIFNEGFKFAVMDDVGIIKLVSFRFETPVEVLAKYIVKAATFLQL